VRAGNTAVYDTQTGTWHAGPAFPADKRHRGRPRRARAERKVLMMASPRFGLPPSTFFEWDGQHLTPVQGTPNAPSDSSFFGNMLVLPTGQILLTDFSNDIEIYTPATGPATGAPVILAAPATIAAGKSYEIAASASMACRKAAAYGDDVAGRHELSAGAHHQSRQLVTLRYSRTHDHSSMAVASGDLVTTHFDVPKNIETGPAKLEVVANGIASEPVAVVVTRQPQAR